VDEVARAKGEYQKSSRGSLSVGSMDPQEDFVATDGMMEKGQSSLALIVFSSDGYLSLV
jgi:hypothetical protein